MARNDFTKMLDTDSLKIWKHLSGLGYDDLEIEDELKQGSWYVFNKVLNEYGLGKEYLDLLDAFWRSQARKYRYDVDYIDRAELKKQLADDFFFETRHEVKNHDNSYPYVKEVLDFAGVDDKSKLTDEIIKEYCDAESDNFVDYTIDEVKNKEYPISNWFFDFEKLGRDLVEHGDWKIYPNYAIGRLIKK